MKNFLHRLYHTDVIEHCKAKSKNAVSFESTNIPTESLADVNNFVYRFLSIKIADLSIRKYLLLKSSLMHSMIILIVQREKAMKETNKRNGLSLEVNLYVLSFLG